MGDDLKIPRAHFIQHAGQLDLDGNGQAGQAQDAERAGDLFDRELSADGVQLTVKDGFEAAGREALSALLESGRVAHKQGSRAYARAAYTFGLRGVDAQKNLFVGDPASKARWNLAKIKEEDGDFAGAATQLRPLLSSRDPEVHRAFITLSVSAQGADLEVGEPGPLSFRLDGGTPIIDSGALDTHRLIAEAARDLLAILDTTTAHKTMSAEAVSEMRLWAAETLVGAITDYAVTAAELQRAATDTQNRAFLDRMVARGRIDANDERFAALTRIEGPYVDAVQARMKPLYDSFQESDLGLSDYTSFWLTWRLQKNHEAATLVDIEVLQQIDQLMPEGQARLKANALAAGTWTPSLP